MNPLLKSFRVFWLRLLTEESGEVAVTSDPAASADPAPVSADPAPVSSDPAASVDHAANADPAQTDPNDPMAALQAAMDAQMGVDDPAADPNATTDVDAAAIPEQFKAALEISPFVNSAESVQQAVRAADEVWKVATGQIPARQMLEGFKNSNPAQFQAIVNDLKDYLGATSQASPLDELKTANPEAFAEMAKYYQAVTGKAIDGSSDPMQARLSELESRIGREDRERAQAAEQARVQQADQKGFEFVSSKLKGTFAEGQEGFLMPLIAAKIGDRSAAMQEILAGNTKTLEKALKAVKADLTPVIKAFNANLVKQFRTMKNAVPAVKGAAASGAKVDVTTDRLPNETDSEQIARLIKEGKI